MPKSAGRLAIFRQPSLTSDSLTLLKIFHSRTNPVVTGVNSEGKTEDRRQEFRSCRRGRWHFCLWKVIHSPPCEEEFDSVSSLCYDSSYSRSPPELLNSCPLQLLP